MMNEPRRMHPLGMIFTFVKIVKSAILPLIALVASAISNAGSYIWLVWLGLVVLFVLFILLPSFLSWYRYKFWVEEGELKIVHGVFVRHHRYIRKERIQSINHSANVIHRLFRLEKVSVETAGGSGASEAELSAVRTEIGKQLEEALYRQSDHNEMEPEKVPKEDVESATEDATRSLPGAALLVAGLTSGKIGAVLVILSAAYSQVNQIIPESAFESVGERLITSSMVFLAGMIFFIVLLAWIASVVGTVLVYWRFTLKRYGHELQTVSGLLERKQLVMPLHRIQAIRVVDGILRQPFGFVTVYAESAGGTVDRREGSSIMLFPLLRRKELSAFLAEFVPDYPVDVPVTRVPIRAFRRYLIKNIVPVAVVVAALITASALWFWPWGLFSLIVLPVVALIAYGQYRSAAWGTTDRFRVLRFRTLNRTTVMIPRKRIQTRTMQQNWFQKRADLASYQVSVMSKVAGVGKDFQVKHLDEDDVRELIARR